MSYLINKIEHSYTNIHIQKTLLFTVFKSKLHECKKHTMPPAQLIRLLKEMRTHLTFSLPFGGSSISEDITFKVLDAYFEGAELSVKILFAELPYSVMGTRHHFDKLIKANWIECRKSEKDARVRLVFPTNNLLKAIDLLSDNFQKTFSEHAIKNNIVASAVNQH